MPWTFDSALFIALAALLGFALGAMLIWRLGPGARAALTQAAILRQDHEWFRTTLASIGDAVIATNADGKVTFLNAVAQSLTGWSQEEARGLPLTDVFTIINESTRQTVENPAERALRVGAVVGLANHTLLIAKDGSHRYIDDSAAPIRDESGGVIGVVLVFRDVSERRQTERESGEGNRVVSLAADVGNILTQSEQTPEFLRRCAEALVKHLDGAFARIWTLNPAENMLELQASAGMYTHLDGPHSRVPMGQFKIGLIAQERKPHLTNAVVGDPRVNNQEWAKREGMVAFAGYPLIVENKMVGVMAVFARHILSDAALRMMSAVADQIAVGVESRRFSEALQASEERLRRALSAAQMAAWEFHPAKNKIVLSESADEVFGLTPASPMETAEQALSLIHPADREHYQATVFAAEARDESYVAQFRMIRPDNGAVIWMEDRGHATREGPGSTLRFVGVVTDVTQQKLAETRLRESHERFRFLAESMPQKMFTATRAGDVDYFNQQWTEFTGLSFEQIKDWGWTQFIHPDDVDENVRVWKHSIDTGEPFQFEHRFRRADGQYRWHLSRARAMRDEAGEILLWIGTNTDVDDVKRAEEAFKDASRRKDEFLATLAHELRNPLAPLRNGLQVLRLAGSDPKAILPIQEMMERQLEQLVRLVDDLLDMSRIDSGKIELRKERLDVAAVVESALETSRPLIEAGRHELIVRPPAEPIWVTGDFIRLAQVVANLLNNSAKYTPEGGHIWLTVERRGEQALIRVRDDGMGVPCEMLPKIFDMFTQVDRNLKQSQGGLGIGLTLVRRLIEMHDGKVEAVSEGAGRGCEFIVTLPLAAELSTEGSNGQPKKKSERAAEAPIRRILVVDDNKDSAESLSLLLQLLGNEVYVVHDGRSALEAMKEFRPAVVLLDIGLPGMSGHEVARKLRATPEGKNAVLIAQTGWGQEEDRQRSTEAGFDAHLVKPLDFAALQSVLAKLDPAPAGR